MENSAAAKVIEDMIQNLKQDPAQFSIQLKVIGQAISARSGGIGQINTAYGGGFGSSAIGNKVTMDGSTIEIGKRRADEAMQQQMSELVGALEKVASEFRAEKPDKGVIQSVVKSLGDSWVPTMITTVITSLASLLG